ncbi:MAG: hypothetical protein ACI31R_01930 [Bacilli bacterium]
MVLIEELLFDLEDRLNKNKINSKDIDKFLYVYGLEEKELKSLLDINWNDKIILENLIKTFSSNNEYKKDKIELLTLVSDNTDIKKDKEKILACTSIINNIEFFQDDKQRLTEIVNKLINSKTEEGAIVSKKLARDILEFINEEDYDEQTMYGLRIRLAEIIGFITRTEEKDKIVIADKVAETYPKDKLGTLCGIVCSIMKAENKNQTSTIVDIANNKEINKKGLALKASLIATKLSDEKLLELYQVLDCSGEMTESELNDELEYIINKQKQTSKQRKISANK